MKMQIIMMMKTLVAAVKTKFKFKIVKKKMIKNSNNNNNEMKIVEHLIWTTSMI